MLPQSEAKIERAKEQIGYLESEFTAFVDANSTGVTREEDPQTGEWLFRFQTFRDVPLRLSVIVGEVLHDLRSSLDQIVCHLIQRNGGSITKRTGFPIAQHAKDFEPLLLRKVDGARAEVMDIIRKIEPYPGGNGEGLWLLNEANVEEKHKLFILVGCGYRSYAHDPFADIRAAGVQSVPPMKWVITGMPQATVKHGKELLRVRRPLGPQFEKEYEFTFEIAFSEPKMLDGKAITPTLTQFVDLTKGYIQLFDPWL